LKLQHSSSNHLPICSFDEYIKICKKYGKIAYITIRDKYIDEAISAMFLVLDKYNMRARCIINSFTLETLKAIRKIDNNITLSQVLSTGQKITKANIDIAVGLGNCQICGFDFPSFGRFGDIDESVVEYAKQNDIRLYQSQVNSLDDIDVLMKYGISGAHMTIAPTFKDAYLLTEADKTELVTSVLDALPDLNGGGTEEWVEVLNTTLAEDVAYVDIVAPDGKMLKKLNIHINTDKYGLSTASKVIIKGSKTDKFSGNNSENLVSTQNTINTYSHTVFFVEKGSLFPFAFSSIGAPNGTSVSAVYMGGVTQLLSTTTDARYNNPGPWKTIRIQPQTADVLFKAGVNIQVWGVYE
jgi:hypothetical protein